MIGSGTFSIADPSVINPGDKVYIELGDGETYTGTITAPGEFSLDPKPWPFGTILHARAEPTNRGALMLIRDSGGETIDGMILYDSPDTKAGEVLSDLTRSNWEPDTP